jgi:glutathione S-transferase
MLTLLQHSFCPHSRFVRLALAEHGLETRLVEERVWERREAFLELNPAGTTPVLVEEGHPPVPGAAVIAEYLDETRGAGLGERRLLPVDPIDRVEVRRLTSWFNDKFFDEVSGPMVNERCYRRYMRALPRLMVTDKSNREFSLAIGRGNRAPHSHAVLGMIHDDVNVDQQTSKRQNV